MYHKIVLICNSQQKWHPSVHIPQLSDDISVTFSQYYSTGGCSFASDVFHSSYTDLRIMLIFLIVCVFFFSFFFFCFIWVRIVELFSPGPISAHWGVLSKCLAYSKAASDPFVYSLLRHQYRKTCSFLANKVLKRSPLNSSSLRMESSIRRNNTNSNTTNNIQPPSNLKEPLGQWTSSPAETTRASFPQLKVSWIWHLTSRYTLMRWGVWQYIDLSVMV